MKKITLLLFVLLSLPLFAQDSDMKVYLEKTDTASLEQYELIKKVNLVYPDIMISKQVKNKFKNNFKTNELLSSDLVYENTSKFKLYNVTILDNRCLSYTFLTPDDVLTFGEVRTFDGNTVRTLYRLAKGKSLMQYFINGKLINEVKG
ncbi:hypothetical protein [Flavobacterium sp. KBS0721]|uniref:hypothetical protein n=1 Tax=Flavobacterium sp. KBS0721 TaxID=1179672 RepID=UPI00098FEBE1|nr:hypothetical protein [Flavobacterium sp. KBS0721]QDW21820.1 hypothetical protein B0M43_0017440 [Flavobacterium sp. KBS0721]